MHPGHAPTFVCSKNDCTGFDLLLAIDPILVGAAMVTCVRWRWRNPIGVDVGFIRA
jgi:hypothetical protein